MSFSSLDISWLTAARTRISQKPNLMPKFERHCKLQMSRFQYKILNIRANICQNRNFHCQSWLLESPVCNFVRHRS